MIRGPSPVPPSLCPQEEFGYNAETQKLLCKNGETLLGAVNFFVSSINTLVNKTMEDTLMTVKQYETARWDRELGGLRVPGRSAGRCLTLGILYRLEYDAYRTDLEELSMGPRDAGAVSRLDAAQSQFQSHKDKYEKLRADVAIKLKFLEENKVGAGVGGVRKSENWGGDGGTGMGDKRQRWGMQGWGA